MNFTLTRLQFLSGSFLEVVNPRTTIRLGDISGFLSLFSTKDRDSSLELADFETHHHVHEQKVSRSHAPIWPQLFLIYLALLVTFIAGCTSNRAFRTGEMTCQDSECGKNSVIIEHHETAAHEPLFDLAFVEFTERGNVFDREAMETVLSRVRRLATEDTDNGSPCSTGEKGDHVRAHGALVVVFVHGWRHSADVSDTNVKSFRGLLEKASDPRVRCHILGNRKLVGVYVGWRGLVLNPDPLSLSLVSYWDRKAAAHEVGKGGVSELLLRLQNIVLGEEQNKEKSSNLFLVTGHSFGGAIVLSALNEVLLERIVTAQPMRDHCDPQAPPSCECLQTRPFAHGVVLLNPAIEANDVFQVKELVAQKCFASSQNKLLHVISSDTDIPTHVAFPAGQWLAMRWWKEAQVGRKFGGVEISFDESKLDTTTIGNFSPFRTDKLIKNGNTWDRLTCENGSDACLSEFAEGSAEKRQHIPVLDHEPVAFIATDCQFINDHNDVFNENVVAYLAAIVDQTRAKQNPTDNDLPGECKQDGVFNFEKCFNHFLTAFPKGASSSAEKRCPSFLQKLLLS